MATGILFEVKKFGTTIELDGDLKKAESAFNQAAPGEVEMLKLDVGTQTKAVIRRK